MLFLFFLTVLVNIISAAPPNTGEGVGTRIVNRAPSLCTTLQGQLCQFPFIYKGVRYDKCSYADSATPWCATELNTRGEVITNRWGDCASSSCQVEDKNGLSSDCITNQGPVANTNCVFPFRHNGVIYNECTTAGLGRPWCSVLTYANGSHAAGRNLYGLCPETCSVQCSPGEKWQQDCNTCTCDYDGLVKCTLADCYSNDNRCYVKEGPASGQDCVFPFRYAGHTYYRCATWTFGGQHQGKLWCSTRTDGYDNHVNGEGNFGFCSPGCASDYNVGERSKFSSVVDLNDGDYDAINLPVENSAVVFDDETEEESIIVLPPN